MIALGVLDSVTHTELLIDQTRGISILGLSHHVVITMAYIYTNKHVDYTLWYAATA